MYVYFIIALGKPKRIKIGKSRDPEKRLKELQTGCPYKLKLDGTIKCNSDKHALEIEKAAHDFFSYKHARGEWFKCTDHVRYKIWELTCRFDLSYKPTPDNCARGTNA